MWDKILDRMLRDLFSHGALHLTYPDGTERQYGPAAEPTARMAMHDPDLPRLMVLSTELAMGEAYMDGRLTIENDDLDAFFGLVLQNTGGKGRNVWWRKWSRRAKVLRRRIDQNNPMYKARENVAHHYDLSPALYDLFLDADRQYSCAYFRDPDMTLEDAQAAKKHHIAKKLLLEPDMEVLDIGCGWGGMALTLARDYGARVLGVTLSEEQHKYATDRAEAEGLSDRVRFELRDYRKVTETFDRVVSVGMFEHVGVPHYAEFFDNLSDRMKPDGVTLLHSIGRAGPPSATSRWIAKYIFPGGYIPALSEVAPVIEQSGLHMTDLEVWRLHYAETLKHWSDRFIAREDEARALYDDRFCRMWRYYLKAAEHTFRSGKQCVFHMQLSHKQDAVPLTRDYLYPAGEMASQKAAE